MSMANYLRRFLFKWKYAILILGVISAVGLAFFAQLNRWLPEYAQSCSHLMAQEFQTKITFKKVYYRFPNHIIFKDLYVLNLKSQKPLMQAPKVVLGFSLPLFSSMVPLDYVAIKGLKIDAHALDYYRSRRGPKTHAWLKELLHGKLHLNLEGQLSLTPARPLSFTVNLILDQAHVNATGTLSYKKSFNYTIKGLIIHDGFNLDRFTMEGNRSSVDLWGAWHGPHVYWKGFIFYGQFYILDINGNILIDGKNIVLQHLFFSMDGDDVSAQGKCAKQDLFQCEVDIDYQKNLPHISPKRPLKNITLHLQSHSNSQGLIFKGWTNCDFLATSHWPTDLENIHLDFHHLQMKFANDHLLKIHGLNILGTFTVGSRGFQIPFKNILASLNFSKPYHKTISLSASLFGGQTHSRIFVDTSLIPWQLKSYNSLKNLNMDKVSRSFSPLKPYHGRLSTDFELNNASNVLDVNGTIRLNNGDFNGSVFQQCMVKILQMPSLTHIHGAELSGLFRMDGASKTFDHLKLNADGLNLSGFFHIDADDLVTSRLSLRFSQDLLKESPLGRRIIGLVGRRSLLPFEFSLSGELERMNFQWDNSPLKDQVHHHMFPFFERIIDRRMDAHPGYKVTIPSESVSPG